MNTSNVDILKGFLSVLNRKEINDDILSALLKRWNLEKVDLDEEMLKINAKTSRLSRSRRDAVPLFIQMKKIVAENEAAQTKSSIDSAEPKTMIEDQIMI